MSEAPALRTIPYVWRHEDETGIVQEYLAAVQQEREQGVHSDDESELSDSATYYSDSNSESSEPSDGSSAEDVDEDDDDDTDDDDEEEEDLSETVLMERRLRETQLAWDDVACGNAPFDSRRKLVRWHESLMRALNEFDDEYAQKKKGRRSKAVQRREAVVDLNQRDIDKVVEELRLRSTLEVENAPIQDLRRGLVYLAQALHLREDLMDRGNAYPPTFEPPLDDDEEEYVFV